MKFVYLETKNKRAGHNATVASFFFHARGDYLERSIIGMYRSLLFELLNSFSDLQVILDNTDIVPWNQEDCPDLNVLKELIRGAVLALDRRSFTCFIDALDECDEREVRDMVEFFEDLAQVTTDEGIQFRICLSSRPYPYIDIRKGILLTLEDESGHAEDLAEYVKSHLRIKEDLFLRDLQSQILDKAAGIFMWIVLVVGILNTESANGALALRKKLSEIPAKLGDLFKSMLTRDQESVGRLRLCILWILCAKRPLSPAEFRHAAWAGLLAQDLVEPELPINTDEDHGVRLVTTSSKGLAEVTKSTNPESESPTVQFIHESIRDFLLKEQGLQCLWPDLGFEWEGTGHGMLKRCCATYLDLPETQAVVAGREAGVTKVSALAKKYSFLAYASQHILHHSNVATRVVPQDDFLTHFFASGGIVKLNRFETDADRKFSYRVTQLYVLADGGFETSSARI